MRVFCFSSVYIRAVVPFRSAFAFGAFAELDGGALVWFGGTEGVEEPDGAMEY